MTIKVAVIYYSSTGHVYQLAKAIEEGAKDAGAEVRVRKVHELAPAEAIRQNPDWLEHAEATRDVPEATLDDLLWADAYLFGSPTRYGNISAQLKQFLDTTGGIWSEGKLIDKLVSGFTSSDEVHGGQESTIISMYNVFMHWGSIIVPLGYTDDVVSAGGGNPYGTSSIHSAKNPSKEELAVANYQGRRVADKAAEFLAGRREVVPR